MEVKMYQTNLFTDADINEIHEILIARLDKKKLEVVKELMKDTDLDIEELSCASRFKFRTMLDQVGLLDILDSKMKPYFDDYQILYQKR